MGPTQSPGVGSGAISTNAAGNLAVGTSTVPSNVKHLVVASSTDTANYAFEVVKPAGTPVFTVRNDGTIAVAASIPAGVSTSSLIVGGDTLVNGTLYANAFSGSLAGTLAASNVSAGIFGANTGFGNFQFGSSTPIFFVDNTNARVGIGTSTPSQKLWVETNTSNSDGIALVNEGTGPATYWAKGVGGNPSFNLIRPSIQWSLGLDSADGDKFKIGPNANVGTNTIFTITSSSAVGIGTASPAMSLDISADQQGIRLENTSGGTDEKIWDIYPQTNGVAGGILHFRALNDAKSVEGDWLDVYRNPASQTINKIVFPNGNVGIGTATPGAALHITGSFNNENSLWAENTNASTGWGPYFRGGLSNATSSGYYALRVDNQAGTELFHISGNGNVGIGTSSPGRRLEVESTVSGEYPLRVDGVQGTIELQNSGNTLAYVTTSANFFNTGGLPNGLLLRSEGLGIQFAPGGTGVPVAVTMLPSGNVGIGTTNPKQALHVAGELLLQTSGQGYCRVAEYAPSCPGGWTALATMNGANLCTYCTTASP